jgi:hypothetical protein
MNYTLEETQNKLARFQLYLRQMDILKTNEMPYAFGTTLHREEVERAIEALNASLITFERPGKQTKEQTTE